MMRCVARRCFGLVTADLVAVDLGAAPTRVTINGDQVQVLGASPR